MKTTFLFAAGLLFMLSSLLAGQPMRRWAVVPAHGQGGWDANVMRAEGRVTDELTAQLTGLPGVAVIDRASVDKVLQEQNFQNSDRSSAETAARIGKLLGVGQLIVVQVSDASYTTHQDRSRTKTRTTGTIVLRANARMIDVETDVIKAQPASVFQESVLVDESSMSGGGYALPGGFRIPQKNKSSGGDPKVIEDNEWAKASDAVVKELATKLESAAGSLAATSSKGTPAMVAGIANGSVYINRGTGAGVKIGDKYQVIREVNLGLNDPETNKPMLQKQRVCVLTITMANDSNASGNCPGGLAQSKDLAEPLTK